ncbi:hypothetical protein F4679DRAFT_67052 [Xylaria curta]|nr:hypothetical protein F4679DRAFT_67052 [Xylaria curta]
MMLLSFGIIRCLKKASALHPDVVPEMHARSIPRRQFINTMFFQCLAPQILREPSTNGVPKQTGRPRKTNAKTSQLPPLQPRASEDDRTGGMPADGLRRPLLLLLAVHFHLPQLPVIILRQRKCARC